MQTCFETGNDKLYIQTKNKTIHCPRRFATGTAVSTKEVLVVVDFAGPALNMILMRCVVIID